MNRRRCCWAWSRSLLVLAALRMAGDLDYWRRYTAALGGIKAEQGPALALPRLRHRR